MWTRIYHGDTYKIEVTGVFDFLMLVGFNMNQYNQRKWSPEAVGIRSRM